MLLPYASATFSEMEMMYLQKYREKRVSLALRGWTPCSHTLVPQQGMKSIRPSPMHGIDLKMMSQMALRLPAKRGIRCQCPIWHAKCSGVKPQGAQHTVYNINII